MAWNRHAFPLRRALRVVELVRQVEAAVALLGDLDAVGAARGALDLVLQSRGAAARRRGGAARGGGGARRGRVEHARVAARRRGLGPARTREGRERPLARAGGGPRRGGGRGGAAAVLVLQEERRLLVDRGVARPCSGRRPALKSRFRRPAALVDLYAEKDCRKSAGSVTSLPRRGAPSLGVTVAPRGGGMVATKRSPARRPCGTVTMKLLPCAVMLRVAPPREPGGTTTDTAPWGAAPAAAGGDGGAACRARAARQASGEPAVSIDSAARSMSLPLAARTSASVASSQCSNMALRVPTSGLAAAMVLRLVNLWALASPAGSPALRVSAYGFGFSTGLPGSFVSRACQRQNQATRGILDGCCGAKPRGLAPKAVCGWPNSSRDAGPRPSRVSCR